LSTTIPVSRSSYLDNARAVLIFLIVFGHLVELRVWAFEPIYLFLYAFHMPAFAAISGYLTKADLRTRKSFVSLARLVLIYAVFQTIYVLWWNRFEAPISLSEALVYPVWILWWLASLITWRIALLVMAPLMKNRWSAFSLLAVATVLALAAGHFLQDGRYLSLSRSFVFFPFFLGGHIFRTHEWSIEATTRRKVIAGGVLVAGYALLSTGVLGLTQEWLWGRHLYRELGVTPWEGVLHRGVHLALAAALVIACMALVPRLDERLVAHHGAALVTTAALVFVLSSTWVNTLTIAMTSPWDLLRHSRRGRSAAQAEDIDSAPAAGEPAPEHP